MTGGRIEGAAEQRPCSSIDPPGPVFSRSASRWLTTTDKASSSRSPRSRPSTTVQMRCVVEPTANSATSSDRSGATATSASPIRNGTAEATSGRAASALAVSNARSIGTARLRHRLGGEDADVEPERIEQLAHRHEQATREQQHVEHQRAGRGDAQDAERGPAATTEERAPGEGEGPHRRTSFSVLLLTSAHDASTLAAIPSGRATAIDRHAMDGVTRTKISDVS